MPAETHRHYDAKGIYTGKTIVTRESEWTPRAQSRALALAAYESGKCPGCGNYDTLVPLPKDERRVTWAEHEGREFEVIQLRCLACASADIIKRDFAEKHKDYKPVTGHAAPGDGRMFASKPHKEEDE